MRGWLLIETLLVLLVANAIVRSLLATSVAGDDCRRSPVAL